MFISIELFVLISLVFIFTNNHINQINEIRLIIVVISVVCIVMLNLFLFRNYNARYTYRLENEFLEKYNKQQKEYFELLLSKEEETRRFRHDLSNELIELKYLLKHGKYDESLSFITEMNSEIAEIKEKNYSVGNETIDIMLNHILIPVKDKCEIMINGVLGENLIISKRDLCIVVSNLLTNAVEEINNIHEGEKIIKFYVSKGQNNILITVKNSVSQTACIDTTKYMITQKEDKRNHGLGLRNVRKIIEDNYGILKLEKTQKFFIAQVLLKN